MNFDQWRYYLRGFLCEKLKRPECAIEAYHHAMRSNPDFGQAAKCLGYLYATRQEYGEAENYFLQALRFKPKDAEAWFNLGFVRDKAGHKPQAVEAMCEAVRLKPRFDRAWYGLSLAQASLGQHAEAAQALEKAAALQPMNGQVWYSLGMAYHHSRQPDKVTEVAHHLFRFDPVMTRRLIQEAERADLAHWVQDMKV